MTKNKSFNRGQMAALSLADRHALVDVLDHWSLSEIQQVLGVIGRRLATAALIDRLSCNPRVHESTLHDLVVRSLWMFGPEYEKSEICSNATIKTVVRRLFGRTYETRVNGGRRPDIVMVPGGSTYCFAGLELPPPATCPLIVRPAVAVVELKRGGSRLTQRDMNQLEGYAHELAEAGRRCSSGFIHGWVVGDEIAAGLPTDRMLCNAERCYARVRATTFSALSDAARRQLPNGGEAKLLRSDDGDHLARLDWLC
ncbi:hypothetical protein ACFPN2_24835 [Steroidobacter flavus]|uniref:Uncharacterized protein n=1 Tax=Steroidobacter flavus TaxID=1842136 RepID=A0ABV8SZ48_9GAMM